MPLSEQQKQRLRDRAKQDGLDEDELIAAAEEELAGDGDEKKPNESDEKKPDAAAKDPKQKPPLYQYHLPFVTVNEVRERWLELPPIAGGDMNAAKYAAQQAGAPAPTDSGDDS